MIVVIEHSIVIYHPVKQTIFIISFFPKPFHIILIGDWKQCPPVVENGTMFDTCKASILNSHIWELFKVFTFSINLRIENVCRRCTSLCDCAKHQLAYADMLIHIGNGTYNDNTVVLPEFKSLDDFKDNNKANSINEDDGALLVKLPMLRYITNQTEAIKFVFPNLFTNNIDYNNKNSNNNHTSEENYKSAILCAKNNDVDEWNEVIQQLNPNEERIFKSIDMFDNVDDPKHFLQSMLSEQVLNRYKKNGVPPHILKLKEGDICFIVRNLLKKEGLTNNTRVKIVQIKQYSVRVHTIDTKFPKFFIIPRIVFKVTLPYGRSFTMIRKQFPLRLAYSMTYNKSQGQELNRCLVDIRSPPFVHGHLYVALSRIRYFNDIRIFCTENNIENNSIVLKNFVFNQLRI